MTQVNLSMKQTITDTKHRLVAPKGGRLRDRWEVGVRDVAITRRMDKQQGPTVQPRELCQVSYEKP